MKNELYSKFRPKVNYKFKKIKKKDLSSTSHPPRNFESKQFSIYMVTFTLNPH